MYYKVPEYAQKGGQLAVWAMPKLTFFCAVASQIDQWNCYLFSGDFLSWISIAEQTAMSLPYTWGDSDQVWNDQIACTALISLSFFWPFVCILHECAVDMRLCYFSKTTNREYVVFPKYVIPRSNFKTVSFMEFILFLFLPSPYRHLVPLYNKILNESLHCQNGVWVIHRHRHLPSSDHARGALLTYNSRYIS